MHALLALCAILLCSCAGPGKRAPQAGESNLATRAGLPADAHIRLFLLAGQSNMSGRGAIDVSAARIHPRIFMLDKVGQWVPARDPLHFDKPEMVGVGPGLTFARIVAESDPDSVIGLVPSAVGGSAIAQWRAGVFDPATKTHPFDDAVTRARLARSGGGRFEAVLWHQGESDTNQAAAPRYSEELARLATELREAIGAPEAMFLVGGLGDFLANRSPAAKQVQSALRAAPSHIENAGFVPADGLIDKGDHVHFDSASARLLGCRYAREFLARKGSEYRVDCSAYARRARSRDSQR